MGGGSNPGKRPDMRRRPKGRVFCIVLLMSWQAPLFAAKWQVHPRLMLGETYSDNINLAPPGSEKSDFVTQINPGVSVDGRGRRVKVKVNYALLNSIYASEGSRNRSHHKLAASGNAELIKSIFFVDARSSVSQQIVNAQGPVGLDFLNVGNQATVFTYGLSPYLKLRLASYANAELRFSDDHVENQSSGISDAERQEYTAHVNSGPRFDRLQWNADYQQRELIRRGPGDSHYENAHANVRYHLLSSWNILARGGYEDNSLSGLASPYNGSYWSAGLEWAPSRRFVASATTGENNWDAAISLRPTDRTFLHVGYRNRKVGLVRGPSWDATLSHYTRHTTWQGSYSEESTTVQTLQVTGQQFFALVDSQGNPIVDPNTGLPVILAQNVFSLTNEDFLRKRGQLAVTLNTGKSQVVLSVFNERRTYSLSNNSEYVVGTTDSWTWKFAPRTSSMIGGGWQRRRPDGSDRHDELWYSRIGLTRRVSPKVNASVKYSHLERNSVMGAGDYAENRVELRVNMRF
ncbi:MAG: TIGR03016 family PEP-CTERM system-associated outer membrane protein [Gammaproteobacteria bacterium]|jgi:uncharacterized protein (PEP-CTERM system associated)